MRAHRGLVWALVGGAVVIAILALLASGVRLQGRVSNARDGARDRTGGPAPLPSAGTIAIRIDCVPSDSAAKWVVELYRTHQKPKRKDGSGCGAIEFQHLAQARYQVSVGAPGYLGDRQAVSLEAGRAACVLRLVKLGSIAGTVVTAKAGKHVSRAMVMTMVPEDARRRLLLGTIASGRKPMRLKQSASTGEDGSFLLDGLAPSEEYKLKIYHPDYRPAVISGIRVKAGETTRVRCRLATGAFLAGRVVDSTGRPVPNQVVWFLRREGFGWLVEARTRTDPEGRFRSPALEPSAPKRVKAWMQRGGIDQVAQKTVTAPAEGALDLGTIRPVGSAVTFILLNADAPAELRLFVSALSRGTGREDLRVEVGLAGVPFRRDGRARVVGLPVGGATVYSVLDKENREVGRGEFTVSGVDCSIEIELHKPVDRRAQEAREHACRLSCVCRKPCDFVVSNAAGAIVGIQRARKKTETEWRATFKLAKGRYVVHALGSRLAGVEETDLGSSGAVLRLSLAQPVQELRFRVLRDGTPVKGAEAYLKGWDTSQGGVPSEVWAVADDQGRLVLKRIPEEVRSVRLTIIGKDGAGRAVSVGAATTEVDISEQGRR